jgi:hypothetical protein
MREIGRRAYSAQNIHAIFIVSAAYPLHFSWEVKNVKDV